MYDVKPNLIIGFHGCERSVRDQLLLNPDEYKISQKPYDWLGHGLYFWENNYDRALEWAIDKKSRGKIVEPSVIGAVLNLGYCCDFLDRKYIKILADYFHIMKQYYAQSKWKLPENKDVVNDIHKDKVLRKLDCAAIEFMHTELLSQFGKQHLKSGGDDFKLFDSTRGVFTEGGPAFEGAGLFEKSHIQICIRNPNCIKGFFLPRKEINLLKWLDKNQLATAG